MSTVSSPGCVVFLMDESSGMGAVMREVVSDGTATTKTNAERTATALNALLKRLADGPDFDVALVGYQTDSEDKVNVGCRWGGALAGREFVKVSELAAAPLRVEARTRKIPAPGGLGVAREEPVDFPVWYSPTVGGKAPQVAAFEYCFDLLSRWVAGAGPSPGTPLVLHVCSGASADGNPHRVINKLMAMPAPTDPPLLFQAHLAATAATVTSVYPSTDVYLTVGSSARNLFHRTSPLPGHLVEALKQANVDVNPGARGMVYNAKMTDLIRLLGLVKTHTETWPSAVAPVSPEPPEEALEPAPEEAQVEAPVAEGPGPEVSAVEEPATELAPEEEPEAEPAAASAEPETAAEETAEPAETGETQGPAVADADVEKAVLVVLLLDRSVEDPSVANIRNPCAKLQDYANNLLSDISRLEEGAVDVAIVAYGEGPGGQVEVRDTFQGPLEGQTVVPHTELAAGALRVDEVEEQVSNNMGGLVTITRKKPVFFDLEPTAAAPPTEAFATVARIVTDWCGQHPVTCLSPIVLHLTRGCFDPGQIEQAAALLQSIGGAAGPVSLYHLVVTEAPHSSLAYPSPTTEIEDDALRKLRDLSSPLLDRERLAAERPKVITTESLGLVINGKFDLFLDGVKSSLAG